MDNGFKFNDYFFFCLLVITISLLHFQKGFAQQPVALPTDVKSVLDSYIRKGNESEDAKDYNQASLYFHQAGNTYWAHGYLPEAIDFFKKALGMSEHLSNLNGIEVLNTKIGLVYAESKNYESALNYFMRSLDISRKMNRKPELVSSLLNIADSYNDLERFNESIPFLTEAESLSKDMADLKLLRNCYSLMTKVYDRIGDREKSAQYFNLFTAITKKIQQDELTRKEIETHQMVEKANSRIQEVVSMKEAKEQELEEKSQELKQKEVDLSKAAQMSKEQQMQIDLLSKEKALQQAKINQQRIMRNLYLGIIVVVLVIASLTFYGYKKIKRVNLLLNIKNFEISLQKDEIERQADELRDLNALKDKLFSIISHDLRSPLFSLINMLNMAKDGGFTIDEQKFILSELSKNVEYNSELLENLLKWASSQMKGSAINPVKFDIREVALNKIQLYEKAASQKGIDLKYGIDAGTLVFADKDMVDLVLRNLITNAIKFSKEGGEIMITSTADNEFVKVCVADSGQGIPEESVGKLFGKHVFSTRGTLGEKGTGLGLTLCRDFVQMNGGTIWVESKVNKGSKFFFTLPVES